MQMLLLSVLRVHAPLVQSLQLLHIVLVDVVLFGSNCGMISTGPNVLLSIVTRRCRVICTSSLGTAGFGSEKQFDEIISWAIASIDAW